jgi:hypothetical protein
MMTALTAHTLLISIGVIVPTKIPIAQASHFCDSSDLELNFERRFRAHQTMEVSRSNTSVTGLKASITDDLISESAQLQSIRDEGRRLEVAVIVALTPVVLQVKVRMTTLAVIPFSAEA